MLVVVLVVAIVVSVANYLTWLAGRLDRLHARVDAARAALDAQLVRRAAAAQALADGPGSAGLLPARVAAELARSAATARAAEPAGREAAENDLSRALHALPPRIPRRPGVATVVEELESAATRVVFARRFYNDAVRDTRSLRDRRVARWLHLAGHAPRPDYFEIDDTPFRSATG